MVILLYRSVRVHIMCARKCARLCVHTRASLYVCAKISQCVCVCTYKSVCYNASVRECVYVRES